MILKLRQKRKCRSLKPTTGFIVITHPWHEKSDAKIKRFFSDVFPKMWSDFVGCTKSFAASCISSTELSQFNRAVGNSINSVHKMCTNEDYQKGKHNQPRFQGYFLNRNFWQTDYLKSAICIKSAAIDESGCKSFYDELMQEINSPSESSSLCW